MERGANAKTKQMDARNELPLPLKNKKNINTALVDYLVAVTINKEERINEDPCK